ncbi:MAG: lamin tail domain-containing protein, partial [Candidatus Omnitrophica bacterium]|nr:lamin tail domain-containing protein [Candidatus Omnitrophota bacterium]
MNIRLKDSPLALLSISVALAVSCRYPDAQASTPVINEIMASNSATLADEDGDYPDWVEIYNPGPGSIDLDGWFMTDSQVDLVKWRFPAETIAADSYLVVFTSDKNRATPGN